MIAPALLDNLIKVLINLILATAAIIIVKRDVLSLVSTYSIQSLLLVFVASVLYMENANVMLLYLALLTLVSKAMIIPHFMERIQKKLNIKRDVEFHYLSPTSALFASVFIILVVYFFLFRILGELSLSNVFFLGATVGVSLTFMGMLIIFSRKQTITNIVGYLTMENGVLLFGLFLTELPLIIEALIVIDLIMLTLLATILAFGINSSIEEFHARLNPFKRFAAFKSRLLNNEGEDE
ncbi:Uncharacterised protein [uncultured archaeon]|nr:Uncharacterised protein [uncultured archaeon]